MNSSLKRTLKAKRNYNVSHSKFRVANILKRPGTFAYTDKEEINAKYRGAVESLKQLENPIETASTIRLILEQVEESLQSSKAKETGAIVLTIPIGIAQALSKGLRVFLSVVLFFVIDVPSMGSFPTSAYVLPDKYFNTTEKAYSKMRKITGASNRKK